MRHYEHNGWIVEDEDDGTFNVVDVHGETVENVRFLALAIVIAKCKQDD